MINIREIQQIAREKSVLPFTVDKDWVLGHLLNAIFNDNYLKNILVFKGDTCLKKIYINDYRFSEDLDFTLSEKNLDEQKIHTVLKNVVSKLEMDTGIKIPNFKIISKIEFCYEIQFEYIGVIKSSQPCPIIKFDLDGYNNILLSINEKTIIHNFSDNQIITAKVNCYSIDEIFAEKLRCIFQRTRPRDLYDIWFLMSNNLVDFNAVNSIISKKLMAKELIIFNSFSEELSKTDKFENLKNSFDNSLKKFITNLPEFQYIYDNVISKLKSNNL